MSESVSPVSYIGNKGCIYPTLYAFMPPHKVYVEACMGSAETFFRKPPAEKEILNDYNGDLVKTFRVMQQNEKLAYLLGRLYLSCNSEQLFRENRKLLDETPNILDDLTETSLMIASADWGDIQAAAEFLETQYYSFSSTGRTFAIAQKDMTKRFGRIISACCRLRNVIIMHRDYKDCIRYAAGPDVFILLDPPYRTTEDMYSKADFASNEHDLLFSFMYEEVHVKYEGRCLFLITYNNDPYIRQLAEKYGFHTFVQKRLHNMAQGSDPGAQFEELIICNFDPLIQTAKNGKRTDGSQLQLSLFDMVQ